METLVPPLMVAFLVMVGFWWFEKEDAKRWKNLYYIQEELYRPKRKKIPCLECNESGRCNLCSGRGYTTEEDSINSEPDRVH